MDTTAKVRENRARRQGRRLGLRLVRVRDAGVWLVLTPDLGRMAGKASQLDELEAIVSGVSAPPATLTAPARPLEGSRAGSRPVDASGGVLGSQAARDAVLRRMAGQR